ncbi:MAG: PQQ-binding-like beta-propeller repeat protein [Candidatus Bathyarchaeia archaeon]
MKSPSEKVMPVILTAILTISITFTVLPIKAQTTEMQIDTTAYLSFRPNPIGLGQPLLINIWITPATHVARNLGNYTVIITKPDGSKDLIGPIDSFKGDATAWLEYIPDQVGSWKIKFEFLGWHFPEEYVAATMFSAAGTLDAAYYKPSSSPERELIVQQEQVISWPPSELPTDYWTRPVSPENREWASILGNYPYHGRMSNPPAGTNSFASNYRFTPYVQGPTTAHVVWKRLGALSGIIGGDLGPQLIGSGEGTYAGTPNVIFQGRCYQSIRGPGGTDVLRCYDLRTGEIFWEITNPLPGSTSFFGYSPGALTGITVSKGMEVVPGAVHSAVGQSVALIYVGSRLLKLDPYTGAVTLNVTGMSGTYYCDPYVLSVQDLGATAGANRYRLINWTTSGSSTDFKSRIISNISWPFSSLGVCDYEAAIAVYASPITPSGLGAWYGSVIAAASLETGALLWNITDTDTIYSTSTGVADHGKFAICMYDRHWNCYDLRSGKKLWKSELAGYPWGWAWAYSVASAYGKIYGLAYDGVYAFDWDTGKIVWQFKATTPYQFETPYVDENGAGVYSFMSSAIIADGKIYVGNGEHSPTSPITRGWRLFCINATTGEGIWNITGGMTAGAIADGYLTADNRYDGYMYVFGKGKSSVTIEAPKTAIQLGQTVMITGSVLDMSPAQAGRACVAKESMTEWMEYLHMQKSIPGSVKGVSVSLDALDPNGNFEHIGDVVTDGLTGTFGFMWTPKIAGQYKVTATFMGDESYSSSFATTYVGVVEAQSTATPEPLQLPPDNTVLLYGILVAVIIAIIIGLVALIRKR